MKRLENFNVIVYHGYCPDGFTSAWVAQKFWIRKNPNLNFKKELKMVHASHEGNLIDPPEWAHGADILFVDFMYPVTLMQKFKDIANNVFVIDHHTHTEERCKELLIHYVYDVNKSGATLTWDTYFPETLAPWFLKYIEAGDLWRWGVLPWDKVITRALYSYPQSKDNFDKFENSSPDDFKNLLVEGNAFLRKQDEEVKRICCRSSIIELCGYSVPVVNAHEYISEVGHVLAKDNPSCPFAACYWDDLKKGVRIWSLRSNTDDFNVASLCKTMGGGGHPRAAGFSTTLDMRGITL